MGTKCGTHGRKEDAMGRACSTNGTECSTNGTKRIAYRVLVGTPDKRDHLLDLDVGGKIILK
jgi:hypothetical protein